MEFDLTDDIFQDFPAVEKLTAASVAEYPRSVQWSVIQAVNTFGRASANAQGLKAPVTSMSHLGLYGHKLYAAFRRKSPTRVCQVRPRVARLKDHFKQNTSPISHSLSTRATQILGMEIVGGLKLGRKKLKIYHLQSNAYLDIEPMCCLDFFVTPRLQRQGVGHHIFEAALEAENLKAYELAYDRPSLKLLEFLDRHYGLVNFTPQHNQFVVFHDYFASQQRAPGTRGEKKPQQQGILLAQGPTTQRLSHARSVVSTGSPPSDASQASSRQPRSVGTAALALEPLTLSMPLAPEGPASERSDSATASTASQRSLRETPASLDWQGFTGEGATAESEVRLLLAEASLEPTCSPEHSSVAGTQRTLCKPFKSASPHPEESSPAVPSIQPPGVHAFPVSKGHAPSSSVCGGQHSVVPPWAAGASERSTEKEALSVTTAFGELGNGIPARGRNEFDKIPRAGSPAPAGLSRQPSDLPAWISRCEEASTNGSCRSVSSSSSSVWGEQLCAPWATHEGIRSAERGAAHTSASGHRRVLQPAESVLSNASAEAQKGGEPVCSVGIGLAGGLDTENAWLAARETGKQVADCAGLLKQLEPAAGQTSRRLGSQQRSGRGAKDCLTWRA